VQDEIKNMVELRDKLKLSFENENKYWKEFWIMKLGKWPDRIEKVVTIVTHKEDNEESDRLDKELTQFILERLKK
jgi:NCAIR mutase (PurE)-related protein